MQEHEVQGDGQLVMKTVAMPADTNYQGDIFGGWILSLMDLGGGIIAKALSPSSRAATVAIQSMTFLHPVKVGDVVSCFAKVVKKGNKSVQIKIEAYSYCYDKKGSYKVTEGVFTYVCIDQEGKAISYQFESQE